MLASPGGLFTAFRAGIEIASFPVKESLRKRGILQGNYLLTGYFRWRQRTWFYF
jgi:hypothetical protein